MLDMGSIPIPLNSILSNLIPHLIYQFSSHFQICSIPIPFFTDSFFPTIFLPGVGSPSTYSEYLLGIPTPSSFYST